MVVTFTSDIYIFQQCNILTGMINAYVNSATFKPLTPCEDSISRVQNLNKTALKAPGVQKLGKGAVAELHQDTTVLEVGKLEPRQTYATHLCSLTSPSICVLYLSAEANF